MTASEIADPSFLSCLSSLVQFNLRFISLVPTGKPTELVMHFVCVNVPCHMTKPI